ncbi:hypothetical protein CCAL13119_00480 [Campylobacter sp. RM13119]|uniref:Uncharacterized protein n=1 Tax=Campylobacter californiensis TaxID=1032243 RepID=A0ABD4JFR8_9BACT|nr:MULTISPECIES: hypothetical protein [unclassified Campylobacter]MBE2985625.1 hypothetical protein [Campylobacter sp. RM12919]MBE2987346.1 hypothetical protein [Campylobacter sp. RM12920]MBE3022191.1 hypothetical protein [Campylobacter sp. 7477a]MBE3605435.1 hypothetical protein [Campylobacter sp. RM13119]MBE3609112.1 hypothetical protein [Campylobacter sp. RM12916]
MIKKIFALTLLFCVFTLLYVSIDVKEGSVVVRHGNLEKKPLEIELGKYLCTESKTLIADLYNTAQAVMPNGDTYFFNDIGNSFIWLMRQKNKDDIMLWVYSQDSEKYIDARRAWYSRVEMTPMMFGFGAYEFRSYGTSDYFFEDVVLCAARGETTMNPLIYILLKENKI